MTDNTMAPLRRCMINNMAIRNMLSSARNVYVRAVANYSRPASPTP